MHSRKWKGTKVQHGIATASKILPPVPKLCQAQEKGSKGAKVQHGNADKSLPLMQFCTKTQHFKSVKMISNYGG
jgi:hypothetical protein